MSETKISKSTIKEILWIKTHPMPMWDVRNKLEILAVKTGFKPAFLGDRFIGSRVDHKLLSLRQLAIKLGLKYKFTITPPLYFSRKPNVESSFLNAFYVQKNFKALWIYDDLEVESKILGCMCGKLNEGHVLGYPKCCIKWHEEARVLEVEACFKDVRKYIEANPTEIPFIYAETETELYKAALNMKHQVENEKEWQKTIDEHLFDTWKKYPFVPHWACSACLSNKSHKTEELNNKYKELAASVNFDFEKDFISKVEQVLTQDIRLISSFSKIENEES